MSLPKLAFIYAYPLDRNRRDFFKEKELKYPSEEEVRTTVTHWENLWNKTNDEKSVVSHIAEVTKRVPERNLECFVFGAGLQAMSTPFLLPIWNRAGMKWSDEKFVDVVIHELLHIFLSTNNDLYWKFVREKYAHEGVLTQNHILLYAMLYQIYQDIWNTEPMDFSRDNLPDGYARAVQLVKDLGYKELISEYWLYSS